jgi:hypothetical protein
MRIGDVNVHSLTDDPGWVAVRTSRHPEGLPLLSAVCEAVTRVRGSDRRDQSLVNQATAEQTANQLAGAMSTSNRRMNGDKS